MTAAPFTPAAPFSARSLPLLLAPLGQLSGDGQLRELIEERRDRKGPDVELWYLEPALVDELNLRQALSNPPEQGRPTGQPGELSALRTERSLRRVSSRIRLRSFCSSMSASGTGRR